MASKKQTVISRPIARGEHLLVEEVGSELVIYDQRSHVAHALSPLAAVVFSHANGENTAAELAQIATRGLETQVTVGEVREAVAQLENLDLLEVSVLYGSGSGLSRRDALKVFGATGVGVALVSSVAAPTAFAASNQTPSGDSYWCAISTHANGDLSIDPGYGDTGWPQPTAWTADDAPGVQDSVQVAPGGSCAYNVLTSTTTCTISGAPNNETLCTDFGGTWTANKHGSGGTCTGYSSSEPPSNFNNGTCPQGSTTTTVSNATGTCTITSAPTSSSECSAFGGTYTGGTCKNYQPVMAASGGACTHGGTYSSTTDLGYWQCVPCDGSDGYQCCSVVCAPAKTGYAWGPDASESFANVLSLPSGWDPYVGCGYTSGGTNSYTACAKGTGQGTPDYTDDSYKGKYCTYNECGANGGAGCTS